MEATLPLSWRSSKTAVKTSPIHGRGIFASVPIKRNEIVLVKGGHIINQQQRRDLNTSIGPVEIQIGDGLFIAPITQQEREGSMLYSNHSCGANLGMRGDIVFVAMRDIAAGEELTHDWCTTDDDDYQVQCKCGAANCRQIVTGKDWQKPELQAQYDGYFSAHIAFKIAESRKGYEPMED